MYVYMYVDTLIFHPHCAAVCQRHHFSCFSTAEHDIACIHALNLSRLHRTNLQNTHVGFHKIQNAHASLHNHLVRLVPNKHFAFEIFPMFFIFLIYSTPHSSYITFILETFSTQNQDNTHSSIATHHL